MSEENYSEPPVNEKPRVNLIDNLMSMHKDEREAMFATLSDNKDLFNKLIPGLLDPLTDPNQEHDHPLFRHYKDWSRTPK